MCVCLCVCAHMCVWRVGIGHWITENISQNQSGFVKTSTHLNGSLLPQSYCSESHRNYTNGIYCTSGSQVAERLGNRAINQNVAGSIPGRAKLCCVLG